jgi:hypothetical protein
MPATYKFVLSTWLDGVEPRDALQITPTFHHKLASPNLTSMANDLLNGWETFCQTNVRLVQMRCTIYDLQGTPPVYPAAQVERRTGAQIPATSNRDIAVCLSAYADNNRPRYRGRLYIPLCVTGLAPTGANVSSTIRDKIGTLVPLFEGLGGADWDWGVYSRVDNAFRKYTNWWVDDQWDTQRRRGRRSGQRTIGTTSA